MTITSKPDEKDEEWLAVCGQRGWIAITPDKAILKDPLSMKAIGSNKCRVLFLPQNNKNPRIWAPILLGNWQKIRTILLNRTPPFIAKISPNGVYDVKELDRYGRERRKGKKRSA